MRGITVLIDRELRREGKESAEAHSQRADRGKEKQSEKKTGLVKTSVKDSGWNRTRSIDVFLKRRLDIFGFSVSFSLLRLFCLLLWPSFCVSSSVLCSIITLDLPNCTILLQSLTFLCFTFLRSVLDSRLLPGMNSAAVGLIVAAAFSLFQKTLSISPFPLPFLSTAIIIAAFAAVAVFNVLAPFVVIGGGVVGALIEAIASAVQLQLFALVCPCVRCSYSFSFSSLILLLIASINRPLYDRLLLCWDICFVFFPSFIFWS